MLPCQHTCLHPWRLSEIFPFQTFFLVKMHPVVQIDYHLLQIGIAVLGCVQMTHYHCFIPLLSFALNLTLQCKPII